MSQPRNIVRVREASHTNTQSSSWLIRQRKEAIHYSFDWCLLCNRWRNYWKDWKLELENLKWIKQIAFFLQFSSTGKYANSSKQYMKDGMALNSPVREQRKDVCLAMQACNLAPVIGHLSGKFEVLTGECWVWPEMLTGLLSYDVKYKIYFHLRKTNMTVDF